MRYLKLFEGFEDIDSLRRLFIPLCRRYGIENYTINEDGSIDVDGNVNLSNSGLRELSLKFRNVTGSFYCHDNKLTSLEGSPVEVGGDFVCYHNNLTSLDGCPKSIGRNFYCQYNNLTSLEGMCNFLGDIYFCFNPCELIYRGWIDDKDNRDMLLDLMLDYDFLRGSEIIWERLEQFFDDNDLRVPDKYELEKYYTIL